MGSGGGCQVIASFLKIFDRILQRVDPCPQWRSPEQLIGCYAALEPSALNAQNCDVSAVILPTGKT